jgi:lipopolysaccharide transport system ATP-binding protein
MEVIKFDRISKYYPRYYEITGGIKNFIFNFPKAMRDLKNMKYEALKDISFTVKEGEALGFVGRNGAGKSTTLGLIAGVLKPTSGTIKITKRISPLLELGGGFHHDLTGRENIQLNGVLLGLRLKRVMEKMDEIIEFSELGEFIDQPLRSYSSGMKARLGFSVVAHLDPELLLIDEVLGVGDAKFKNKCRKKILSFKESGVTMVLVSHSIKEVMDLCDRVIWIEDKKIRMEGDTVEVLEAYSKFMGVPFQVPVKK